jgi:predicted KAP-like P-loop ATPase
MYLTSQIAIGARDNSEITDIIIQQREPLEKLLDLLDDYDDDYINNRYIRNCRKFIITYGQSAVTNDK